LKNRLPLIENGGIVISNNEPEGWHLMFQSTQKQLIHHFSFLNIENQTSSMLKNNTATYDKRDTFTLKQ